jgi:hypothetical protein
MKFSETCIFITSSFIQANFRPTLDPSSRQTPVEESYLLQGFHYHNDVWTIKNFNALKLSHPTDKSYNAICVVKDDIFHVM